MDDERYPLTPGRVAPAGEQRLRATVEHHLPEIVVAVAIVVEQQAKAVMLHQDAFAAGYDLDECTLLGMAVKYAGLYGVPVYITGKNRETL